MASETSPLLQDPAPAVASNSAPDVHSSRSFRPRLWAIFREGFNWTRYGKDFWLCACVLFIVEAGAGIVIGPVFRQIWAAGLRWCDDYSGPDRDERCRSLMDYLSTVSWLFQTFSLLVATVLQIPMGWMLDARGRRLPLILSISSTAAYWALLLIFGSVRGLPMWTFYLASLALVFGGGPAVTRSLLFAAVSQRVKQKQRVFAFSILQAGVVLATTIFTQIGSSIGDELQFLPFIIAILVLVIPLVLVTYMKDTPRDHSDDHGNEENSAQIGEEEPLLNDDSATPIEAEDDAPNTRTWLRSSTAVVSCVLAAIFILSLTRGPFNIILSWIIFEFKISPSQMILFYYLQLVVMAALFIVFLPLAASWLSVERKVAAPKRDLILSFSAVIFSAIGILVTALTPNLAIALCGVAAIGLGSGFSLTLSSFLTSKTGSSYYGRLFAAISVAESIGGLLGGLIMQKLYKFGSSDPSPQPPFFISAAVYFIVALFLLFLSRQH